MDCCVLVASEVLIAKDSDNQPNWRIKGYVQVTLNIISNITEVPSPLMVQPYFGD